MLLSLTSSPLSFKDPGALSNVLASLVWALFVTVSLSQGLKFYVDMYSRDTEYRLREGYFVYSKAILVLWFLFL